MILTGPRGLSGVLGIEAEWVSARSAPSLLSFLCPPSRDDPKILVYLPASGDSMGTTQRWVPHTETCWGAQECPGRTKGHSKALGRQGGGQLGGTEGAMVWLCDMMLYFSHYWEALSHGFEGNPEKEPLKPGGLTPPSWPTKTSGISAEKLWALLIVTSTGPATGHPDFSPDPGGPLWSCLLEEQEHRSQVLMPPFQGELGLSR